MKLAFDECFLFYVITGRYDFPQKFTVLPFFQPPCCCFFVLQGFRILYVIYTITAQPLFQGFNIDYLNFLNKFNCLIDSLTVFPYVTFRYFFLICEIFFINERNSKPLQKHIFNNMVFVFLQIFLWRAKKNHRSQKIY